MKVAADGNDALVTLDRRGEKLGDSLVLDVRDPRKGATVADEDRRRLALPPGPQPAADRVRPAPRRGRTTARRWVILDDVSASRDPLELRAQADVVDHLLTELDEDDQVAVLSFDVGVRDALAR